MTFIMHTAIMSDSLETVVAQPHVQLCARDARAAAPPSICPLDFSHHAVNGPALDRIEVVVVLGRLRRAAQREMIRANDAVFARNRRALDNVVQFPNVPDQS
jgi:hypothetical protein